jgi:hypothetical protein
MKIAKGEWGDRQGIAAPASAIFTFAICNFQFAFFLPSRSPLF